MKAKFYLITLFLVCTLTGCKKKEEVFTDFKFSNKPAVLTCENLNSKLYNEALYSFEEDILNFYGKNRKILSIAYAQFIRLSIYNTANYSSIVSEHTLKVFETLKKDTELWDLNNTTSRFNYNSPLMDCIAQNIEDKNLKTTLNALLSTNSMSPKLFGTPLANNYNSVLKDKHLAAYVAFDLFYAKLFDLNNYPKANTAVEKTKRLDIETAKQLIKEDRKVDFNITK